MSSREQEALEIAAQADFRELTVGYERAFKVETKDGNWIQRMVGKKKKSDGFTTSTEWVAMDQPRPCSYNSIKTAQIMAPKNDDSSSPPAIGSVPAVEYRAITLRQLRAVWANVERRCTEEQWRSTRDNETPLHPKDVTLYDVNKYVILPFTVKTRQSFVTCLPSTKGPQPPRWFVSHWWGEPIKDFIACLEQMICDFQKNNKESTEAKGGGMTSDTPFWVCAYANNQWELGEDITEDPKLSGFARAIHLANGRTVSVLDKTGVVFTRIWCIFEKYLTLIEGQQGTAEENGLWAIYTSKSHVWCDDNEKDGETVKKNTPVRQYGFLQWEDREAVGIITGGATSDEGAGMGSSESNTHKRERHFPYDVILKSLDIKVETAEASVESDRIHILNSIIGRADDFGATPPDRHPNFDALNNAVKAAFATSPAALGNAYQNDNSQWKAFLNAMSKGYIKNGPDFNFSEEPWRNLTNNQVSELILNLPSSLERLSVNASRANRGFALVLIKAVAEWMKKAKNLAHLTLAGFKVGDPSGGILLSEAVASHGNLTLLMMQRTDLVGDKTASAWSDALAKCSSLLRVDAYALFEDSQLSNEGLKTLCKGIALNQNFYRLVLTNHCIEEEVAVACLAELQPGRKLYEVHIDIVQTTDKDKKRDKSYMDRIAEFERADAGIDEVDYYLQQLGNQSGEDKINQAANSTIAAIDNDLQDLGQDLGQLENLMDGLMGEMDDLEDISKLLG